MPAGTETPAPARLGGRVAPIIVVMGVSGCGKSTVAQQLADAMGLEFLEGDRLHSPRNVARMASGVALTDEDRREWLEQISSRLAQALVAGQGLVLACSALKRAYRDVLRRGAPQLKLVYLHGEQALLATRTERRVGHYMPASLLQSQLATLEPPGLDENALSFDVVVEPGIIVRGILARSRFESPTPFEPDHTPTPATAPATATATATATVMGVSMSFFNRVVLYTDADGRARFRDEALPLGEGSPQSLLSAVYPSGGYQLRRSPVGFRSQFHCTTNPQWVFILQGQMEIGLQDGVSRVFKPGEHFFSADLLPPGATFDPRVHGHWSRQLGPDPLCTLFVRG